VRPAVRRPCVNEKLSNGSKENPQHRQDCRFGKIIEAAHAREAARKPRNLTRSQDAMDVKFPCGSSRIALKDRFKTEVFLV